MVLVTNQTHMHEALINITSLLTTRLLCAGGALAPEHQLPFQKVEGGKPKVWFECNEETTAQEHAQPWNSQSWIVHGPHSRCVQGHATPLLKTKSLLGGQRPTSGTDPTAESLVERPLVTVGHSSTLRPGWEELKSMMASRLKGCTLSSMLLAHKVIKFSRTVL